MNRIESPPIKVGQLYLWYRGYPHFMSEMKNRHYEVVSDTLTHVYLKNLRTGSHHNEPLSDFRKNYMFLEPVDRP